LRRFFSLVGTLCAWLFVNFTGTAESKLWAIVQVAVMLAAVNAFEEEFLNRNVLVGAVRTNFGPAHAVAVGACIFRCGTLKRASGSSGPAKRHGGDESFETLPNSVSPAPQAADTFVDAGVYKPRLLLPAPFTPGTILKCRSSLLR
jgi:hypothetical protein